MLHENRKDVIFANISSFEKETKGEKKKEGAIIKCWGKKGQRFWRKNGHEFSSNGYPALPFSFRPSPVWFARAISTSGLSQFLRGSRYLQRRAFRADTECNSGIYPGQCVCVSAALRGNNVIIARGKWLERNLSTILCLENDEYNDSFICYGRFF